MFDNLKEMTKYLKETSNPSFFSSLNFLYSQAPNGNYKTLYAEFKGIRINKRLPFNLIPSTLDFNSLKPNNFPNLTEIHVVNISSISYINNISNLTQILHLNLSSNSLLNTFSLNNIIALKTLDLSNNPNLQGTLDLSETPNLSEILLHSKYRPPKGDGHAPINLPEIYLSSDQISKIKYIDTLTSHTLTTSITPSWMNTIPH